MPRFDYEEYQQQRADEIDAAIEADPACPADVRATIRAQRHDRRALTGAREYRYSQPWHRRGLSDLERMRLRMLELEQPR